jgi:hypothetical protein
MGARHRVGIGLSYRPAGLHYIGWRNSFLGIDSWAPYTFKNTGSVGVYTTYLISGMHYIETS